jgi:hypothetical protein
MPLAFSCASVSPCVRGKITVISVVTWLSFWLRSTLGSDKKEWWSWKVVHQQLWSSSFLIQKGAVMFLLTISFQPDWSRPKDIQTVSLLYLVSPIRGFLTSLVTCVTREWKAHVFYQGEAHTGCCLALQPLLIIVRKPGPTRHHWVLVIKHRLSPTQACGQLREMLIKWKVW